MLSNNLCPSCCQIYGEFSTTRLSYNDGELFRQPSATYPGLYINSQTCSNCGNFFSPDTQDYTEQLTNDTNNSVVQTCFDGSSSWTNQTYQSDIMTPEYFQETYEDGKCVNITDATKFDENFTNNPVTDEYAELSNVNNYCQDFHLGKELLDWLTRISADADAGTALETLELQKLSESELAQINSMTTVVETQSNFQPQVATGSHSTIAPEDTRECDENLKHEKKVYPYRRGNENGIAGQNLLSNCNRKKSRAKNGPKFNNNVHPVYCIDTNRRVCKEEIMAKIESSFSDNSIVARGDSAFICRFGYNCDKFFTSVYRIKNHLFSHFFFFYCTICKFRYHHPSSLSNHFRTCREKAESTVINNNSTNCIESAPDPGDIQLKVNAESRSLKPFWVKFFELNQLIYRKDNLEKVSLGEVMDQISENHAIIWKRKRVSVCLLDHNCERFYPSSEKLKRHLFCQFYFYRCSACASELNDPYNITKHLMICKGKSHQMSTSE